MRATIVAATALLAFGTASASADGPGPAANTQFTENPGFIARPALRVPATSAAPTGFAAVIVPGQQTPVTPYSNPNGQAANG